MLPEKINEPTVWWVILVGIIHVLCGFMGKSQVF